MKSHYPCSTLKALIALPRFRRFAISEMCKFLNKFLYHKIDNYLKLYNVRNKWKIMFSKFCQSSKNKQYIDSSMSLLMKTFKTLYCLIFKSKTTINIINARKIFIVKVVAYIFCSICCLFFRTHKRVLYFNKNFFSSNLYLKIQIIKIKICFKNIWFNSIIFNIFFIVKISIFIYRIYIKFE